MSKPQDYRRHKNIFEKPRQSEPPLKVRQCHLARIAMECSWPDCQCRATEDAA